MAFTDSQLIFRDSDGGCCADGVGWCHGDGAKGWAAVNVERAHAPDADDVWGEVMGDINVQANLHPQLMMIGWWGDGWFSRSSELERAKKATRCTDDRMGWGDVKTAPQFLEMLTSIGWKQKLVRRGMHTCRKQMFKTVTRRPTLHHGIDFCMLHQWKCAVWNPHSGIHTVVPASWFVVIHSPSQQKPGYRNYFR